MITDENSDLMGLNGDWDSDLTKLMLSVTLTRFLTARLVDYLLHEGQGKAKNIRETPKLSHQVQNRVPFPIQTPSSLDITRSYPNPRFNILCLKDYMYNNHLYHLAKITKFQHT